MRKIEFTNFFKNEIRMKKCKKEWKQLKTMYKERKQKENNEKECI